LREWFNKEKDGDKSVNQTNGFRRKVEYDEEFGKVVIVSGNGMGSNSVLHVRNWYMVWYIETGYKWQTSAFQLLV